MYLEKYRDTLCRRTLMRLSKVPPHSVWLNPGETLLLENVSRHLRHGVS